MMRPTVLIVDDSLTVRMDLAAAYDLAGFVTFTCPTAAATRERLETTRVDVIVLDVLLPDGDGVEMLSELRAHPSAQRAPILMLSTEADVKHRIRGLETGADAYIGKPYDPSYVIAKTQALLQERSISADGAQPAVPTVLVIDDSATYREALREAFEHDGYRVVCAADGQEGLRFAAATRPDGVIVDGILPDIDGAAVIRSLRLDSALRSTPCLLLTASEESTAELVALDAGADAFARKSEDAGVVLAKFRALIRQTKPAVSPSGESSLLGPKKILAVDDSATFLNAIGSQLRGAGYEVVMAHSGEDALELLAVEEVDCILLDLVMPGLSGQDTCRRIKAVPVIRDVPLMMLTSTDDRSVMIDSLSAGADDYISKSSEFEVLAARVRAQLRRKQFEDEHRNVREQLLRKEIEATEARAATTLAETRAALIGELERKNEELEAFSYSVSHDLRAPLRSIHGFSQALLEDYSPMLDAQGNDYLQRVCAAAQRMGELIDDLLDLSRMGRAELHRAPVDVSAIVSSIADDLAHRDSGRRVDVNVADGLVAMADRRLIRAALENLLGNAWKFTAKVEHATITFDVSNEGDERVFCVSDNGDGFDMKYATKLFQPFNRLHDESEFSGTGIGLATVHRIIERHGGRVWADASPGHGAKFFFTIPGATGGVA